MRIFKKIPVIILLLCSLALGYTYEETFKKTLTLDGEKSFSVKNINGSIDVISWDRNEIGISAFKKVKASSREAAQELMKELDIEIVKNEKGVSVEVIYPNKRNKSGGFFSWLFGSGNSGASVEFEIKVPRNLDLFLKSTNGNVTVSDCKGKVELKTTNGNIRADEMEGVVSGSSTNGSIKVYLNSVYPGEEMEFKTTNGSVRLYLPENININLEARTTNGSIRCDLPLSDYHSKSKKKLDVKINDGGPLVYIKTTNGSIHIYEN